MKMSIEDSLGNLFVFFLLLFLMHILIVLEVITILFKLSQSTLILLYYFVF